MALFSKDKNVLTFLTLNSSFVPLIIGFSECYVFGYLIYWLYLCIVKLKQKQKNTPKTYGKNRGIHTFIIPQKQKKYETNINSITFIYLSLLSI